MAAEDAAKDVDLVDHHVPEPAQQRGPAAMPGEDPDVQHVRIGEDDVGVAPHPGPSLVVGVSVVHGGDHGVDPEVVE